MPHRTFRAIATAVRCAVRWGQQQPAALRMFDQPPVFTMRSAGAAVRCVVHWRNQARAHAAARHEGIQRQFHLVGMLAIFCRRWIRHRARVASPTGDTVTATGNCVGAMPSTLPKRCISCLYHPAMVGIVSWRRGEPSFCYDCE